MKTSTPVLLALVFGASAITNAGIITEWNFNGGSATTVPGGNLSPTPSTGSGTASLVGGVTAATSFGSGTSNGGSSDPVTTTPANYAWQTTTYPGVDAGNKTAGTQYAVSTAGFFDIFVEYDLRHSNTSSRYEQFQYSIDGTNFVDLGAPFDGNAGDTWFNNRVIDLSAIDAVENNPNFAVRIVSSFAPGTNTYVASNSTASYATTGTWRFDMVQVMGTAVPEPISYAWAALGFATLSAFRRNR